MRIIHLNDKLSPHLLERELPVSHKRKTNDSQSIRLIPQLGALMAFDRAAAHLSFRRAARDLALSPSGVSHQIRGPETHFGVSLFVHSGCSVQLTSNGEQFLQSVRSALDLLDGASRDLFSQTRGSPGQIRISALPFLSTAVLIPALGDLESLPRRGDPA